MNFRTWINNIICVYLRRSVSYLMVVGYVIGGFLLDQNGTGTYDARYINITTDRTTYAGSSSVIADADNDGTGDIISARSAELLVTTSALTTSIPRSPIFL